MDEELEQEVPEFTDEEIAETKKDPFEEFFEENPELIPEQDPTQEQLPDQTVNGTLTEEQLQQIAELIDGETSTSVPVDVLTFNTAIHNMTVELSSVIIFCAFLIAGTMAAIKLWGARL